jgi:hypothetical protein
MSDDSLDGFLRFVVEGAVVQFVLEVAQYGRKFCHFFCNHPDAVPGPKLEAALCSSFYVFPEL